MQLDVKQTVKFHKPLDFFKLLYRYLFSIWLFLSYIGGFTYVTLKGHPHLSSLVRVT